MKIYIVTDLEGPAGVNRWIQTREGETPEKHAAMRLLTQEVNAAIDGILDVEPEAIIPGIVTVTTKEGLAVEQALHLSAEEARRQICRGTAKAIRKIGFIAPYRVPAPYELEIRLLPGIDPTPYIAEGRYQLVGEQTLRRCAERMEDLR